MYPLRLFQRTIKKKWFSTEWKELDIYRKHLSGVILVCPPPYLSSAKAVRHIAKGMSFKEGHLLHMSHSAFAWG